VRGGGDVEAAEDGDGDEGEREREDHDVLLRAAGSEAGCSSRFLLIARRGPTARRAGAHPDRVRDREVPGAAPRWHETDRADR
jgi:hypothetical protein